MLVQSVKAIVQIFTEPSDNSRNMGKNCVQNVKRMMDRQDAETCAERGKAGDT